MEGLPGQHLLSASYMASLPSTIYVTLCSALYTPFGYMPLLFPYHLRICDVSNCQCPAAFESAAILDEDCLTAFDVDASLMILASCAGSLFACCGN